MPDQPKVCTVCGKPTEIIATRVGFDAATGRPIEVRLLQCVSYSGIGGRFQAMSDAFSDSPIPSHTRIALP
jgi:hypothetical protein